MQGAPRERQILTPMSVSKCHTRVVFEAESNRNQNQRTPCGVACRTMAKRVIFIADINQTGAGIMRPRP